MQDLENENVLQVNKSFVELNEHDTDKITGGKRRRRKSGSGSEEGEEGGDGSDQSWKDRYHTNRENGQNVFKSAWHATIG